MLMKNGEEINSKASCSKGAMVMVNDRFKGGINMNLNDSKLIFVVSPSDDNDEQKTVKEVINQLIKDDKKNNRDDLIYINSLNTFGWMNNVLGKDDLINCNLKLLTKCDEIYVLPNYELDELCNQCIGISKLLGIPITYL